MEKEIVCQETYDSIVRMKGRERASMYYEVGENKDVALFVSQIEKRTQEIRNQQKEDAQKWKK